MDVPSQPPSQSRRSSSRFGLFQDTSSGGLHQLIEATTTTTHTDISSVADLPALAPERYVRLCDQWPDWRQQEFLDILNELRNVHCLTSSALAIAVIKGECRDKGFSGAEVDAALRTMQDENLLMIADDEIYFLG